MYDFNITIIIVILSFFFLCLDYVLLDMTCPPDFTISGTVLPSYPQPTVTGTGNAPNCDPKPGFNLAKGARTLIVCQVSSGSASAVCSFSVFSWKQHLYTVTCTWIQFILLCQKWLKYF